MKVNEIRQKFLKYFESQGHEAMASSSLIPKDDPSVLLTTAGMQQFKTWYSGEVKPRYPRVATVQKAFRTSDIEEVGDKTHHTFFEMLGNFSFGDYFKEEAIKWALEFIEGELNVERERIWVSIFQGDEEVPRDEESRRFWKSLGINDIREFGREDNFWGPTGSEGPCGPTTEIYVDDVEVWNIVFNEYYMQADGVLLPLEPNGVDTGAGIERLAATINRLKSNYDTDEISQIGSFVLKVVEGADEKTNRVVTDHLRAATFLLADGVRPSNLGRGYILRRLIRRAVRYGKLAGVEQGFCSKVSEKVIEVYGKVYPNLEAEKVKIITELDIEESKFRKVIEGGLKKLETLMALGKEISGPQAFELFATYGFPFELTEELATEKGIKVDQAGFTAEFEKHQEVSRAGMDKKFAGGLADKEDPQIVRYHTAAHLLLAALRRVLGEHVHQKGSNITAERIRFDFSHDTKMTDEEKQLVEDWVNAQIHAAKAVEWCEVSVEEAKKAGAEGEFSDRYGDKVKVYSVGGDINSKDAVSREICGGPHVANTSELGHFKIKKEESSSSGVRRIKAVLE
jgi:alanyl-tRNA synthetase